MNEYSNRPYDLANPHELKAALLHTVSTYMDYAQYVSQLDQLNENFDETLEHSDFSAWLRMGSDPESVDDLTAEATMLLGESAGAFERLCERAKKNLVLVLKAAFVAPPDIQLMVFGCAYSIAPGEIEELLENLFESITEIEYEYNMEKCLESFLRFFKNFMEQDDQ